MKKVLFKIEALLVGVFVFFLAAPSAFANAVTAVTTVTDLNNVVGVSGVSGIPYVLALVAVIGAPILTQLIKTKFGTKKWVTQLLPTVLGLITGIVTATAMGQVPWSAAGFQTILTVVLGAGGGQGVYVINKIRGTKK